MKVENLDEPNNRKEAEENKSSAKENLPKIESTEKFDFDVRREI